MCRTSAPARRCAATDRHKHARADGDGGDGVRLRAPSRRGWNLNRSFHPWRLGEAPGTTDARIRGLRNPQSRQRRRRAESWLRWRLRRWWKSQEQRLTTTTGCSRRPRRLSRPACWLARLRQSTTRQRLCCRPWSRRQAAQQGSMRPRLQFRVRAAPTGSLLRVGSARPPDGRHRQPGSFQPPVPFDGWRRPQGRHSAMRSCSRR